jgi:threonine synthase
MSTRLACVAGCDGSFGWNEVVYTCPRCSELLEVRHDAEALASRSGAEWRALFDSRAPARVEHQSGVWAKREWVLPELRNECRISLAEGHTPMFDARRYGESIGVPDLWIKQCGSSHTGSFKDLGMTVLVSAVRQMVDDGQGVAAVACASTGDTSAALAAYCAVAGLRAVVLLPRGKITTAQLVQPLAHGALVCAVDTDFDGCMAIVKRLATEPGIYLANSMNALRLEGQKTVGIEVVQQLDWTPPDWFVIPGGNLGNVAALAAGLDLMLTLGVIDRRPRICVAQAERANPLYRASRQGFGALEPIAALPTEASAIRIGNPVSYRRAVRALEAYAGVVEQATEAELAEAAAAVDRTGAYACPHTGVALAATAKLARRGLITRDQRTVVVSTASGLKFTDFKVRYHDDAIADVQARAPNRPVELPNDYDAVRAAVLDRTP